MAASDRVEKADRMSSHLYLTASFATRKRIFNKFLFLHFKDGIHYIPDSGFFQTPFLMDFGSILAKRTAQVCRKRAAVDFYVIFALFFNKIFINTLILLV